MKSEKEYFAEFKIDETWIKTECFNSVDILIKVETVLHEANIKCRIIEKMGQFNIVA